MMFKPLRIATCWTAFERTPDPTWPRGSGGDRWATGKPGLRRRPRALEGSLSLDRRPLASFMLPNLEVPHSPVPPTVTFQKHRQEHHQDRERQGEPHGWAGGGTLEADTWA